MENHTAFLHHKPVCTANTSALILQILGSFFICKITMGNKSDYSAMTFDNQKINFIGRSADDKEVIGKVDCIPEIIPYPPDCITVALGGILGSSFVQTECFCT